MGLPLFGKPGNRLASLSGKERCWSVVPVCRGESKTDVRSETLSLPLYEMETIGAACEPGNVSTRAAPMESVRGPDPSGSPPGSSGSAEPQLRQKGMQPTNEQHSGCTPFAVLYSNTIRTGGSLGVVAGAAERTMKNPTGLLPAAAPAK